jgi:hypothetical protein
MPPLPGVRPDDVRVVVVEQGDTVVAALTVLRATHFEGIWIDPAKRNGGVTRALLRGAMTEARQWTDDWVFAAAADDRMRDVLDRIGGIRLPIDSYVLSLGGDACRPQS